MGPGRGESDAGFRKPQSRTASYYPGKTFEDSKPARQFAARRQLPGNSRDRLITDSSKSHGNHANLPSQTSY